MKPHLVIKTVLLIIMAIAGWYGLVLQLYLIIQRAQTDGLTVFGEVVRYFSYFTILTNLLVAICVSSILLARGTAMGRFFSNPVVQSGIAIYILVVGITYSVALRHIWNPAGLQLVADRLLHDVIPILFMLYWVFFVAKNMLRWSHPLWWLLYPFVYLVYIMIRGGFTGAYPYYFLDPGSVEWRGVWMSILVLFAAFAGLGFLVVGISRLLHPRARNL